MAFKLKKIFKKKRITDFVKGVAIAASVVYGGPLIYGALGATGTAGVVTGGLTLAQRQQQAKAAASGAMQASAERDVAAMAYSAPFNPGYSYSGSPADYSMGAGGQVYGGSGAAVPIIQQSGETSTTGFAISPIMAIVGIGVIALIAGMFFLRR